MKKNRSPIMLQGAMDVETELMIHALQDPQTVALGPWEYTTGTLEGYPAVVCRTHIGMVNAAASTALGIRQFQPAAIINQGTAGGHDPELHKHDIILAKAVVNIGSCKTDLHTEGKGSHPEGWQPMAVEVANLSTSQWEYVESFEADSNLLQTAQELAPTYTKGRVVLGTIGSGDQWNREIDRILWLNQTFGTSAEEMETAAAAQVAQNMQVPFLGIRILSNNEIHGEDYDRTTGEACQCYTLEVAKAYIKQYLLGV